MTDRALALEMARLSEEATPKVLAGVLEMFWACKREGCGKPKDMHPMDECEVFEFKWGPKDGLELLDRLGRFSRHEGKVDDALGLNKREVQEQISWLIGVDLSKFKHMSMEERERVVLDAAGGARLIEQKSDPAAP